MGMLSWAMSIQVGGAATIVVPRDAQPFNAHTQVQEVLKSNESCSVQLPDGDADDLDLLVVRSDAYDEKLLLRTSGGAAKAKRGKRVRLTEPLVLSRSALGLIGQLPKQLALENGSAKTATIEVLVYRRTPQRETPKEKKAPKGRKKPK